jgi:peptidoglycan/LPS O-acetylase OafA/YrhL
MKDNPFFRALIAGLIAFAGAYVLWWSVDADPLSRRWAFWLGVVLIGIAGGSLWRRPLIGALCGAIGALAVFVLVIILWTTTHPRPRQVSKAAFETLAMVAEIDDLLGELRSRLYFLGYDADAKSWR